MPPPAPPDSGTALLPQLYARAVGPLSSDYYRARFERFEALGRPLATWNSAAGLNTLAWLCMRRMWLVAAVYATVIALVGVLWLGVLAPLLPASAVPGLSGVLLLVSIVVPGYWGDQLYYRSVRAQTLEALGRADTLSQAQQQLDALAITAQRRNAVAAVQAALALAAAGLWLSFMADAPAASPQPAPNGPPVLHFPPSLSQPPAAQGAAATSVPSAPTPPAPPSMPVAPTSEAPAAPALHAPQTIATAALTTQAPSATPLPAEEAALPPPPPAATPTRAAKTAVHAPAPPGKAPASPTELLPGRYYLNAGIYAQTSNADKAEKSLRQAGLPVLRSSVHTDKGQAVRLRSGPFDSASQARTAQRAAAKKQLEATVFQHRS